MSDPTMPAGLGGRGMMDTWNGQSLHYVLADDGETPVPVPMLQWAISHNSEDGRIGNWFGVNADGDRVQVSTVFLGVNHDYALIGPPILWETMLFGCPEGSKLDQYCNRYTSAKAAKRGQHWCVWLMQRLGFVETTEECGE